jgi:hypothetical protein
VKSFKPQLVALEDRTTPASLSNAMDPAVNVIGRGADKVHTQVTVAVSGASAVDAAAASHGTATGREPPGGVVIRNHNLTLVRDRRRRTSRR